MNRQYYIIYEVHLAIEQIYLKEQKMTYTFSMILDFD